MIVIPKLNYPNKLENPTSIKDFYDLLVKIRIISVINIK